jgi:hypothetical protein
MTGPDDGRLAAAYARHRGTLQHTLDAYAQVDQVTTALRHVLPALFAGLRPDDEGAAAVQLRGVEDLVRAAVLGSLTTLRIPPRPVPPRPRTPEDRGGIFPFRIPLLSSPPPPPPPPPPTGPVLVVHVPTLLDQLQAVFEAADRVLAAAEPPPAERVVQPWADDKELVDLFHDLLTADLEDDGELALHHVTRLRKELVLRHGIRRVLFDGSNEEYFAFTAGPGAGGNTTIRPALVTDDGRILRRGEVRGSGRAADVPDPTVPDVSEAPVRASVISGPLPAPPVTAEDAAPAVTEPPPAQRASDQTASDQTASDQTASDQTASDQTASDQTASDQTASDQTASAQEEERRDG